MRRKLCIIIVLLLVSISGCQETGRKEEVEYNSEILETYTSETTSLKSVHSDLLYREYLLGEKFCAGTIEISKETVLSATKDPESVAVYYNDELFETIDYNNKDIEIELIDDGKYCFIIVDKNGEVVDITLQIQGTSYPEDEVTYLK